MIENSPFCYNIHKVKAIVLGADPGNFSDHGEHVDIKVAFAIGSGDARYFDPILKNLQVIGLSLTDVYIQNLITSDTGIETGKNNKWEEIAESNLDSRISEFRLVDNNRNKIPVLVSAERILRYLSKVKLPSAEEIYLDKQFYIIQANNNKLDRPIHPFFRNMKYSLSNEKWEDYRSFLAGVFH